MWLKVLFERDNIDCPDWLLSEQVKDDLLDSEYSNDDGIHVWTLKNEDDNLKLTFDGEEYVFSAFHEEYDDLLLFKKVLTEDYGLTT